MKENAAERLKDFLNREATVRLGQLGHSDKMIRHAKREAWWWIQARRQAAARGRGLVRGSAVVWTERGRCELVPIEVTSPGRGEVTVEIAASAISPGTERARYLGLPNAHVDFPHRPGQSAAGRVVAVGRGVTRLKTGDLIATIGVSHASVATIPEESAFSVPDGVSAHDAAFTFLGVISAQGARLGELVHGESVCVFGAGLIGALAQRLASAAGSGLTSVVAASRRKEAIARGAGVDEFLVASEHQNQIADLNADLVIEATGDPEALGLAVTAARPQGRIVLLGSPRGLTRVFPLNQIREKRLHLVGAHVLVLVHEAALTGENPWRRDAVAFLAALAEGRIAIADLVGVRVDPREADSFYRDLTQSREIVGAVFDWTRLPSVQRLRRGRLARLPDLAARGVEFRKRPLGSRIPNRRGPLFELHDPFAGAKGNLRIGLLGCGDIAGHNATAIVAAPNAELVACYDPVHALADDVARTFGGISVPSVEALLARTDVDAVFLSVPHHLHTPLAVQAAAAGRHVMVEKPLANNLAAAVEAVSAAEKAGVALSVCFPYRYHPSVILAKKLIADGALGDFSGALVTFLADKPPSYWVGGFRGRSATNWRASRADAGGGVLIMNLSHHVDMVRHLVGIRADAVTAVAAGKSDVEDSISVSVRYTNGALGSFFGCSSVPGTWDGTRATELRVWGSHGHVSLEGEPEIYSLRSVEGMRTNRWHSLPRLPEWNLRGVFISRFATAVSEGQPPEIAAADGLEAQAFIEAAYVSSETGEQGVRPAELLSALNE